MEQSAGTLEGTGTTLLLVVVGVLVDGSGAGSAVGDDVGEAEALGDGDGESVAVGAAAAAGSGYVTSSVTGADPCQLPIPVTVTAQVPASTDMVVVKGRLGVLVATSCSTVDKPAAEISRRAEGNFPEALRVTVIWPDPVVTGWVKTGLRVDTLPL